MQRSNNTVHCVCTYTVIPPTQTYAQFHNIYKIPKYAQTHILLHVDMYTVYGDIGMLETWYYHVVNNE